VLQAFDANSNLSASHGPAQPVVNEFKELDALAAIEQPRNGLGVGMVGLANSTILAIESETHG